MRDEWHGDVLLHTLLTVPMLMLLGWKQQERIELRYGTSWLMMMQRWLLLVC
jgi:hypothetical protein